MYALDPLYQKAKAWASAAHPIDADPRSIAPSVGDLVRVLSVGSRQLRDMKNGLIGVGKHLDDAGPLATFDHLRQELVELIGAEGPGALFFETVRKPPRERRAFAAAVVSVLEVKGAKADQDVPFFLGDSKEWAAQIAVGPANADNPDRLAEARTLIAGLNMATGGSDVEVVAEGIASAAGLGYEKTFEPPAL